MVDPDRVLVSSVGVPREEEALEYALSTFPSADVTLLVVTTPIDARLSEGSVLERDEEREADARETASDLVAAAGADPERVGTTTATGKPGDVVPRYAAEHDVDHVVLRGRDVGWLARRLLGRGIATTVVERTSVPVTVVD